MNKREPARDQRVRRGLWERKAEKREERAQRPSERRGKRVQGEVKVRVRPLLREDILLNFHFCSVPK